MSTRHIGVYGDGNELLTEVDPADSSTPVQDAMAAANSHGGTVILPPGTIADEGPLRLYTGVDVFGHGIDPGGRGNGTTVEITSTGVDGMNDGGSDGHLRAVRLDGFTLEGPGPGESTGPGFNVETGLVDCTFGALAVRNFGNSSLRSAPDAEIFQVTMDFFAARGNDPGTAGAKADIDLQRVGNGFEINHIETYSDNSASGALYDTFHFGVGAESRSYHLRVGSINDGGDAQRAGKIENIGCRVGFINFEPAEEHPEPPNEILELSGSPQGSVRVDHLKVARGSVGKYAVSLTDNPERYFVGPIEDYHHVTENLVEVASEPAGPCWYWGSADDIDNTAGSSTGYVRAMADAGTGTG